VRCWQSTLHNWRFCQLQSQILGPSLRISGQLPAPIGLGHTAYRRASLIDLYLRAKFHWNWRNFLWTDGRTDGHLRPALLGRLWRVDIKMHNIVMWWLDNVMTALYCNVHFIRLLQWNVLSSKHIILIKNCGNLNDILPEDSRNSLTKIEKTNIGWLSAKDVHR